MSVRVRPVVRPRRRSRLAVRSNRTFFVASHSSRKTSFRRRRLCADIPSSVSSSVRRLRKRLLVLPKAIRFSRSATHSASAEASWSRWCRTEAVLTR